jgi:hypothetical protein
VRCRRIVGRGVAPAPLVTLDEFSYVSAKTVLFLLSRVRGLGRLIASGGQ